MELVAAHPLVRLGWPSAQLRSGGARVNSYSGGARGSFMIGMYSTPWTARRTRARVFDGGRGAAGVWGEQWSVPVVYLLVYRT